MTQQQDASDAVDTLLEQIADMRHALSIGRADKCVTTSKALIRAEKALMAALK